MKRRKITKREKLFCDYLLNDKNHNISECLRKAGYSENTAKNQSLKIYGSIYVQEYLAEVRERRAKTVGVTKEQVLKELSALALLDPIEIYRDDFRPKEVRDIPPLARSCIKELVITDINSPEGDLISRELSVRLNDKDRAISLLSKHFGLFERDNKQAKQTFALGVKALKAKGRDTSHSAKKQTA